MQCPPSYLLIENVVGFERSQTHEGMLQSLQTSGFVVQVRDHIMQSLIFCRGCGPGLAAPKIHAYVQSSACLVDDA